MLRSLFINASSCFLLFLAGVAGASEAPSILVVGDSLSAGYGIDVDRGWVALLAGRLDAQGYKYSVVNASVSGETTGGARARLSHALDLHHPAIVVLELGGNDGLRGLPIDDVTRNLEQMIGMSAAQGARVLLVGMMIPPNYGPKYADAFGGIYRSLAGRLNVPLVPFFLDGVALDPDLMQDDGLHPNERAQKRLLDNVWPRLEPLLDGAPTGRPTARETVRPGGLGARSRHNPSQPHRVVNPASAGIAAPTVRENACAG
jgi:acyl-CoA thioesterase I